MKKILVIGKNSFIGNSFEEWLKKWPDKYHIETVSARNDIWKQKELSQFDVVLHVAGIAHVSTNKIMKKQYYEVNRDLAIETAKNAKAEGVKQFIFMSSIIVYGDSSKNKIIIDKNTNPTPSNFYGDSKLQAEEGIRSINDANFKIVVLRPPMIYGKGSKGNYPKLAKAAQLLPVFPDIENERSMLHIDNLCEFIRLMVDYEESGLFFPQNSEYVKTSEMVKLIAEAHGKKIKLVKGFNFILKLLIGKVGLANKVFGNLVYEKSMSSYDKSDYRVRNLKESIDETELRSNV